MAHNLWVAVHAKRAMVLSNLDCVHCYAKPGRSHTDMSTDEFKAIVDILAERGLMDAYFTGREIFTRPDFKELFLYTKRKGVLLSLLSNITLLTKEHIKLFKDYPVKVISTANFMLTYGDEEHPDPFFCTVAGLRKKFVDEEIARLLETDGCKSNGKEAT